MGSGVVAAKGASRGTASDRARRASARASSSAGRPPSGSRKTEPFGFNPSTPGIVQSKHVQSSIALFDADQLRDLHWTNPMRLVQELPYLHPSVDMALQTAITLMFPAGGVSIVAQDLPIGNEPSQINADDTHEIEKMFDAQPPECGGSLQGLLSILGTSAMLTAMPCVECILGPGPLDGVERIWPVDALTIGFGRKTRDADLTPFQYQRWPSPTQTGSPNQGRYQGYGWGWQELDSRTFFWRGINQSVNTPEGRAPYASAAMEVLADLAMMQDLRDAVHNAAWPRYEVGVNLTALHKVAVEVYKITNPKKAAEWVTERFNEAVNYVASLHSDDNVVHDSSGDVKVLQPGSFQGLEGVLSFLRQRIAQSLKTLPTLLGINDGSTFNYTSVEWGIYAASLEAIRSLVVQVAVAIAQLHLNAIGSKSVAYAKCEKVRTNDDQVDANTLATTITNATNLEKLGHITHDEGARMTVGHDAVDEAMAGVLEPIPNVNTGQPSAPDTTPAPANTAKPADGGNNKTQKTAPGNAAPGTTQEERNANKKK